MLGTSLMARPNAMLWQQMMHRQHCKAAHCAYKVAVVLHLDKLTALTNGYPTG